jgi:hypothetical protein
MLRKRQQLPRADRRSARGTTLGGPNAMPHLRLGLQSFARPLRRPLHGLQPEQVLLAAVDRWLKSGSARKKVTAWSNIGDAIRQEVSDAKRMAAANAAAT